MLARTGNPEVSAVALGLVPCGGAGDSLGQIDSTETLGSDEEEHSAPCSDSGGAERIRRSPDPWSRHGGEVPRPVSVAPRGRKARISRTIAFALSPPRSAPLHWRRRRRPRRSAFTIAMPRKVASAPTDGDDSFDDSRHLRGTLASNPSRSLGTRALTERRRLRLGRSLLAHCATRVHSPSPAYRYASCLCRACRPANLGALPRVVRSRTLKSAPQHARVPTEASAARPCSDAPRRTVS
jgi:hypothetical protein